jgi:hypothetical protein
MEFIRIVLFHICSFTESSCPSTPWFRHASGEQLDGAGRIDTIVPASMGHIVVDIAMLRGDAGNDAVLKWMPYDQHPTSPYTSGYEGTAHIGILET